MRTLRVGEEKKHFETLNLCYERWGDEDEWKRRYLQFPKFNFVKNVLVVEENGEWAGGGTAWFREAILSNDNKIRIYLAGDLYVLPPFQGKGIYSTAMRSLNEMARKNKAVLGFGFPTNYGLAAVALPKYGFTDIFYPITHIFLLRPERFLNYLFFRIGRVVLPKKFNNLTVKLLVSVDKKSTKWETKTFRVEEGKLKELKGNAEEAAKADLTIKANIEFLMKALSLLYRRKRTLYVSLLFALLRRRVGIRLSLRFLRVLVGL